MIINCKMLVNQQQVKNSDQMKAEHKGHTTIIKDTKGQTADFLMKVTHKQNIMKNN